MSLIDELKKLKLGEGGISKLYVDNDLVFQVPSGSKNIITNGNNIDVTNVKTVNVNVILDGAKAIMSNNTIYTLSAAATKNANTYYITVPYDNYNYIALLGAYPGSAWISQNDHWEWPHWQQLNSSKVISTGVAESLSNIKPMIYSKANGDVLKFALTTYRPDDGYLQTLPIRIARFN